MGRPLELTGAIPSISDSLAYNRRGWFSNHGTDRVLPHRSLEALRSIANVLRMSDTHEGLPLHLVGANQEQIDRHALDLIEGEVLRALSGDFDATYEPRR